MASIAMLVITRPGMSDRTEIPMIFWASRKTSHSNGMSPWDFHGNLHGDSKWDTGGNIMGISSEFSWDF